MKWKEKGYELDRFGNMISDRFKKCKKIYVFGAGMFGNELKLLLDKYGCFAGFIDNNVRKQETGYLGSSVLSLSEYMKNYSDSWIIIAASILEEGNGRSIRNQLEDHGFENGKDFFGMSEFLGRILPVLSVYYFDKMFMQLAQICLTERCSLKCKKCAHACYAVDKNAKDMDFEMVCNSADSFFNKVNLIHEFVLIGGEPLLYKNIENIVQYIGERYRDQIAIFSITTNGTIMPWQELIDICRQYDVTFRISNYSRQLPWLERKYEALVSVLAENQIHYTLAPADAEWMDYGFEYVERIADEETLERVFDECRTPCREVRGNRLYYCVMARSVSDNLKMDIGADDYLDLSMLNNTKTDRKVLLEYTLGYSDKGYLEMCRHCHGKNASDFKIPAAEQM